MLKSDNILQDRYFADEDGNIYHLKLTKLDKHLDQSGYEYVNIHGKMVRASRFIAEQFLKNPNNLPEVDHINRIKTDNRVCNLRWVSKVDNCRNKRNNIKIHDLTADIVYNSGIECAEALGTTRANVNMCIKHNCLCKNHKLIKL